MEQDLLNRQIRSKTWNSPKVFLDFYITYYAPLALETSKVKLVRKEVQISFFTLRCIGFRSVDYGGSVVDAINNNSSSLDSGNKSKLALAVALLTADYKNEAEVGEALADAFRAGLVKREELFITTKLWNSDYGHAIEACKDSLKKLQLDYMDLYLVHFPVAVKHIGVGNSSIPLDEDGVLDIDTTITLESTWRSMEELVSMGLVRSIGIRLVAQAEPVPYKVDDFVGLNLHSLDAMLVMYFIAVVAMPIYAIAVVSIYAIDAMLLSCLGFMRKH
ncbi:hypothetical protein Syun_029481 [Stephania yunnanensis]|uniref:NADP-dependent oxidoreductase domain-containing protein n=1 Tax=Stephania yunnanensis TaxID=152371 RepID=A0AAP0HJI3_9MAGN